MSKVHRMIDRIALTNLLIFAGMTAVLVAGMIILSYLLGSRHRQPVTGDPYECGIRPTGSARLRLPAHYYVIAIFFVIFDVETAFIFAWAIAFREAGITGYAGALLFIAILLVVIIYEWRSGAFDFALSGKKVIERMKRKEMAKS